jgi:hypothetical protein
MVAITLLYHTSSKRHNYVTTLAKDDLSKFVVKEMGKVRKQYGLRKSDASKKVGSNSLKRTLHF